MGSCGPLDDENEKNHGCLVDCSDMITTWPDFECSAAAAAAAAAPQLFDCNAVHVDEKKLGLGSGSGEPGIGEVKYGGSGICLTNEEAYDTLEFQEIIRELGLPGVGSPSGGTHMGGTQQNGGVSDVVRIVAQELLGEFEEGENSCCLLGEQVNGASDCGIEVLDSLQLPCSPCKLLEMADLERCDASEFKDVLEDLEMPMEGLSLIDPSREFIQKHQVDDAENGTGKETEISLPEVVGTGTSSGLMTDTANMDENSSGLVVGSGDTEENSFHLPNLSGDMDSSFCRQLTLDDQETGGPSGTPTCTALADSSTSQPDDGGKDNVNNSNTIPSSTRKSTRRSNLGKMPEIAKPAVRGRKTFKNKLPQSEKSGISMKFAKRKRTCGRQERSSIWGSMGNILQVFTENDGLLNHDTDEVEVKNQRPGKRISSQGNEMTQKSRAGGKSPTLKENCRTSEKQSGHLRVKLKVGGEQKRSLSAGLPEAFHSPCFLPTADSKCVTEPVLISTSEVPKADNSMMHKVEKNVFSWQYSYLNGDLEKPVKSLGAGVLDSQHGDKDLESTVMQDTSFRNTFSDCPLVSSRRDTLVLEETVDKRYSEAGTSPDSEVINSIPDVGMGSNVLTSSQAVVDPIDAEASSMELISSGRGNKLGKVKGTALVAPEKLLSRGHGNKSKKSAKKRPGEKVRSDCNAIDTAVLATTGNTASNCSILKRLPYESLVGSETGRLEKSYEEETIITSCEFSGEEAGVKPSKLWTPGGSLKAGKSLVPSRSSKSTSEVCNRRSRAPDSERNRRTNGCEGNEETIPKNKETVVRSVNEKQGKEKGFLGQVVHDKDNSQVTEGATNSFREAKVQSGLKGQNELSKRNVVEHELLDGPGKFAVDNVAVEDVFKLSMMSNMSDGEFLSPRKAWVLCDDCHKWRCISATLADSIEETDCRWTCKDNMDKAYADCSIPQEKTNAEINEELEISDASGEEDASGAHVHSNKSEGNQLTVTQQAQWKPIVSNLFLHRSRKAQTIDEVMVCQCKPPRDGSLGCRDECLNRMLNIECDRGTCPCGDLCSNRQFQKRKYAKLEHFRCGKKGYGLQLLENVTQGRFLIEYVGEVLDLSAYEARQREYASRGQRHFYFMTLNGSEVIDACAKGNLGRFINHSCDPNCRTEKWMVNGEVCIGLFAIRDIKKGEEVTFDYNYVRVFGAAAKKCVCGSSECRGFLGGDPSNTETTVQSDSDEEFPEPVMVREDGCKEEHMKKGNLVTRITDAVPLHHTDTVVKLPSEMKQLELCPKKADNICQSDGVTESSEVLVGDAIDRSACAILPLHMTSQRKFVTDESLSVLQSSDDSSQNLITSCKTSTTTKSGEASSPHMDALSKSSFDSTASNSKLISSTYGEKLNIIKASPQMKLSRLSSSIKKGRSHSHSVDAKKPQLLGSKSKKLSEDAANNRFKGVEEKLNELLDADGGISKRRDSSKGYLKLLLVTAASGDNVEGEAVQSTRDLSIILDALLKTRSRVVLVDVINKNGLQMLHNIMKQHRRNFKKIPIIRKLLKVVTFLAEKEILTSEHINSAPPCAGVESFKESIIALTRHLNVKVHQIARSFRDRWIPRTIRKGIYSEKDGVKLELQGGPHCNRFSLPYNRRCNRGLRTTERMDRITRARVTGTFQNGRSGPCIGRFSQDGARNRKRKSRWDQPAEAILDECLPEHIEERKKKQRIGSNPQQSEIREVMHDKVALANSEKICSDSDRSTCPPSETACGVDELQDIHNDAPPGFSSPLKSPWASADDFSCTASNHALQGHNSRKSWEVSMGYHQERYIHHLPVSFGIPMVFVDQLGTSQSEIVDSWTVAPGIPFHPFPPLPSYPRERRNLLLPLPMTANEHGEEPQGILCSSGARPSEVAAGASNHNMIARVRCSSGSLGRRYFKQQKWSNRSNCPPPWVRNRMGNNKQNSSRSWGRNLALRNNFENDTEGVSCSEGVSGGSADLSSNLYQRPQHPCDH